MRYVMLARRERGGARRLPAFQIIWAFLMYHPATCSAWWACDPCRDGDKDADGGWSSRKR